MPKKIKNVSVIGTGAIVITRQQTKGKSIAMLSNIRDEYLINLQKLRKKYENKIIK